MKQTTRTVGHESKVAVAGLRSHSPLTTHYSRRAPLTTHHSPLTTRGQASLEMTVALMGTLLLLFGSVKVFVWMTQRLVTRQQGYEATRVAAGSALSGTAVGWSEPSEPLRIFDK